MGPIGVPSGKGLNYNSTNSGKTKLKLKIYGKIERFKFKKRESRSLGSRLLIKSVNSRSPCSLRPLIPLPSSDSHAPPHHNRTIERLNDRTTDDEDQQHNNETEAHLLPSFLALFAFLATVMSFSWMFSLLMIDGVDARSCFWNGDPSRANEDGVIGESWFQSRLGSGACGCCWLFFGL